MAIKVSVIVPTYKRMALLTRCIDALTAQQFDKDEYEIIVVTDGPCEASIQLMEVAAYRYAEHTINIYSTPQKKGPAAARNYGWQQANGELIVFTDDDCIPSAQLVDAYWQMYSRQRNAIVAFNGPVRVPLHFTPTDYEKNTARLEQAEFITANCACSRSALEVTGGFDEAFAMAWREDSDLHFKLIEAGIPIVKVPAALVIHPVRSAMFGVSLKEQKKSMYNALLFKKYPRLYRQKIGVSPLWNYYLMILLLLLGIVCITLNNYIAAIIALITWGFMVVQFTAKRLNGTSLAIRHVSEMLITSVFIPFLSVYWTLYGSLKYKKLLL